MRLHTLMMKARGLVLLLLLQLVLPLRLLLLLLQTTVYESAAFLPLHEEGGPEHLLVTNVARQPFLMARPHVLPALLPLMAPWQVAKKRFWRQLLTKLLRVLQAG